MPRLPETPRDARGLPVEGYVRRLVWGILFVVGSVALFGAAAGDHGRADWMLASGPLFAVGVLILLLARRYRRRVRALYSLGREMGAAITQITTVYRNGLLSGWVTTFRLNDAPGGEVKIALGMNPELVPMTLLVLDGWVGVHAEHEKTRLFRRCRLPAA
ncbi:MAG TPA: hypothetical protein VE981_14715 [Planctomycetota bacterium]|nr:hypothetical protein [Planctomycetota bacterium]